MDLDRIMLRVRTAEAEAGRERGAVRLVAVSKQQPVARIATALAAGQRLFGENRVQEAAAKWPALRERFGGVKLHLLGPLQANKARSALGLFDAIHSLDRARLAEVLARLRDETGHGPELFVQVNTGAEPQKAGVLPEVADALIAHVRALELRLVGLMCIPPAAEPPLPHFQLVARIAARNGLSGLSMGMSDDFETAIAAGATHVRVGSALFGARDG